MISDTTNTWFRIDKLTYPYGGFIRFIEKTEIADLLY